MKRKLLGVLALAAASLCLIGAGRDGGGGGERSGRAVYRRKRVAVPKAEMPSKENVVRDQARPVIPERNESGERITQRRGAVPPSQHASVVRNGDVVRGIQAQQRTEVVPNHYYWHNVGGVRYSHYYDGHYHWYGFYHGPTFYWTRYYGHNWWWYDPLRTRWVFWWNGFWWWPGPGGAAYVYVDNNYYPYEGEGVTVEHVQETPAPSAMPEPNAGQSKVSPDKRRAVQIFGAEGQAFLYDDTKTPPAFMKYLGEGVSSVRYSGGTGSAPLQILVEYKDNTFALFDADGNSQSSAVQSTESSAGAPPETPDSIPPPPTSAPGQ